MASVREIARKTGLSAATVSRALKSHPDVSDETRSLVFDEAERMGYFSQPKRGRGAPVAPWQIGTSIGYVAPGDPQLWEYDLLLLNGVIEGLRPSKMDVRIVDVYQSKSPDETYSEFFKRSGLSGVVMRSAMSQHTVVEEILDEDFPCVVVAQRYEERPDVSYVWCDSRPETAHAVEHLADLGHERIALVLHRRPGNDHLERQRGFIEACDARGIEVDSRLIIKIDANIDGGMSSLNRLMSLTDHPTAIVFTDPLTATGALIRAQEVGLKIPDDLSIVGFDDGTQRYKVYPRLTAICQDTHELGVEAGKWLGHRLRGLDNEPLRKVFHATLEINQTTGVKPVKPVRLAPNGDVIS